jgi:hypothetical protein
VRGLRVTLALIDVSAAELIGQQQLHGLAQNVHPIVPEHCLGHKIELDDPSLRIHDHDRVRQGVEQCRVREANLPRLVL